MSSARRRRGVPGPVRRLLRERGRAAAIVLVAVSALATAGIQVGAATAMRTTLDANWRGAYDILVTAADATAPIDGMLPPNSLTSGESGMTAADLDAVRGVDGVEVAAPIGQLLVPGFKSLLPLVIVPRSVVPDTATGAQAYRVTAEYTTDDGLGERVVSREHLNVVIDGTTQARPTLGDCDPNAPLTLDNLTFDAAAFPALAAYVACDRDPEPSIYNIGDGSLGVGSIGADAPDAYTLGLQETPMGTTTITLVDPVAEHALLGDRGDFLAPLTALTDGLVPGAEMKAWADGDTKGFGKAFIDLVTDDGGTPFSDEVLADIRRLYAQNGLDWDDEQLQGTLSRSFMPLLVSDAKPAQLTLKLSVEGFGQVTPSSELFPSPYQLPAALLDGEPGTDLGATSIDISGALNPFVDENIRATWPGAALEAADALPEFHGVSITSFARAVSGSFASGGGTLTTDSSGFRAPLQAYDTTGANLYADIFDLHADATAPGTETAYVDWTDEVTNAQTVAGGVPVGTFSSDDITSVDALNYVPLGAYAAIGSTISDGPNAGTEMLPSVTGLGLVSPRTVAIGSITAAQQLGLDTPINAIRVRVGGIDAYTPEAQQRVLEVAQHIRDLGFAATVVAGSSPSDVSLTVDGYAFGAADFDTPQRVGSLGEIVQRWSELGAAARAEFAISDATVAIVAIGLASSILLFAALQLTGIPRRREQAAGMRELGFTRPRIARWFGAEEVPGILVIGVVIGAAVLLSASGFVDLLLVGVFGLVLLVSAAAVAAGSRPASAPRQRRRTSRRLGPRSITAFGTRQAWKHPLTSTTQLLAIAIVAASSAGLVSVFLRGRAAVGQSLLAGYLSDQQFLPQLALGVTAVLAGAVLAGVARGMELRRRQLQWSTLRATGWTRPQISRAQWTESAAIVLPSLAVALGLVVAGVLLLDLPQPWLLSSVAGAAALATALTTLSIRSKGSRA
ncbi:hypothetical protein [Protaetiibacter intestinalis]|uniref:FtsX-like permease family protein n=1 Tax=Protaetiibacter intestinalis TaxID=2419774 RepID=A0A387B384_9MICO|nr:hypothetical protein [Protaetiibacter intestinalis]AYF96873.1 hypothetical protein D7I47_00470 [Protaetiibacter intestinalis]